MVVKLVRAHGGCLGTRSWWRTWRTTICFGELYVRFDPEISEWVNPARVMSSYCILNTWVCRSNPVNWNILVAGGTERKIDFLSSGERNGKSPNQSLDWGCRTSHMELQNYLIVELFGKANRRRWKSCRRNLIISEKYPEYGETRVILSESAGTIPQG